MIRNPISWLLASAALVTESSAQSVTHRWNFNSTGAAANGTVIPDQITGATGTIVGINATRTGSQLTLPGGTNGQQGNTTIAAYFDMPNGFVSSKTNFTIEIWATIHSSRTWQRIFDFGRMDINASGGGEVSNTSGSPGGANSRDNLMLVAQRGDTINDKKIVARNDGQGEIGFDNSIATSLNTQYHYVATYQANPDPSTGGRFTWFRNGAQQGFVDTNFPLTAISDVNNWLGRSQYTSDQNSNISYNEFRLYDYALTQAQITASGTAGPDQFPLPVAVADSVTMRHGNKAKIPVLKNDTGEISISSFTLLTQPASGTAVITADKQVLYTHTTGTPVTDSFTYQITNTSGQSSTGTITINFTDALKIANANLNVPASPPPTVYAVPNAFGTLSFNQPVCMATPPGETQRLFVCEKGGLLRVISDVTASSPTATTFLSIPTVLSTPQRTGETIDTGSECGLLGLAFHPQFATNRQFFVFYSVTKNGARYQRVSRFTTQTANPNLGDPASEKILIEQLDDRDNHNGGDLHFGPTDGYLYISVGDEGSGNDDPVFNSQLINKDLFSGILRIDVDRDMANSVEPTPHASIPLESGVARFAIPKTNPFVLPADGGDWNGTYNGSTVSGTVRREFWATGLRNPWRMSFDPVTGILWCADVGQGAREEVDKIVRGGNYGWVYREGNITGPRTTNPPIPANFDTLYHKPPVYDYPRTGNFGGASVTGGRIYRGTGLPGLTGKYIFGDHISGNIWAMNQEGAANGGIERLLGEGGVVAYGVDPSNQDLLLADIDGLIRRLSLGSTTASSYPSTLTATGLFADVSDLSPSPGLTPYSVNLPFWSDHAIKSRWVIVPDGTSKFTNSPEASWTLPNGTVWVKHFDMEMQRGVPSSKKRIETRLIVKNPTGAYGVSYRWNEAGTEATLAADAGENFTLAVTDNGNPVPQTWRIPSRAECMVCHTPQAGHALSWNTRQLNLQNDMDGITGNQLTTLFQKDYLTADPGSPNLLPRHLRPDEESASVEARVRSYLAVNCSYCHKAGGTAPSTWDGSATLTLAQTNLVNGTANNAGSDPLNKLVVPGDTAHSIVLSRMAVTNGFTRMPPLGSNVLDQQNIDLVTTWINGELEEREDYAAWRVSEFDPEDPAGAPDQDPDGDGSTNAQEFLAGTGPLDGSSAFRPQLTPGEENALTLSFELPVNRSFRIETSDNLGGWTPWDVPGNEGLPVPGGLIEFTVPITDPLRFFRVNVMEN